MKQREANNMPKAWGITIKNQRTNVKRTWLFTLIVTFMAFGVFSPEVVQAVAPTFDQSSYRFLSNVDAIAAQNIVVNHTAGEDTLGGSAIDAVNGYMYIGGYGSTGWIIEKRLVSDGSLDPLFGTAGQIIQNIAGVNNEGIADIKLDLGNGSFYIAGWDYNLGANDPQWRIEKRNLVDGSLVNGFGTAGIVLSNPTVIGDEQPRTMIVDSTSKNILVGGYDSTGGGQWRIEKRSTLNGALDTGFATAGVYTFNSGGRFETIQALAIDSGAGFFYMSGGLEANGNVGWQVEKRLVSTGALCTALACGIQFGTGGVFIYDPSSSNDSTTTIQVDIAGDALYFGGTDANNGGQWRIAKVTATTGVFITEFGVGGTVTSNPGAGEDFVGNCELDGFGGFLYCIGSDSSFGNEGWRMEKRTRSTGALVNDWGVGGAVQVNPSVNIDPPNKVLIDLDRSLVYAVGSDRTLGTSNSRWRLEQYVIDTGTRWIGLEDTITLSSTKVTFRLRLALTVGTDVSMSTTGPAFKLQYAFKVATCDTAFVGEIWSDVSTSSGEIRYHNNPTLAGATAMEAVTGDPTAGTSTIRQTYEESNTFTASSTAIVGQSALWDLSLEDQGAFGAYCFRIVYSDNTLLASYSIVPEISFCKDDPRAENIMRHGTFFCEGTKRSFFWAN